jgi:outer membrane protein W
MRLVRPFVGLMLLVASGSALAEAGKFSIGARGSFVSMNGSTTVDANYGVKIDFASGWGAALGVGYGFSDLVEGEVAVSYLRSKGELDIYGAKALDLGKLEMIPVSAMVKVHPLCPGSVDLWLGAGGAWVWISDLESSDLLASGIGRVEVKSRAAFLAGLGADFRIAPNVWLSVEGRYLPLKPDSHGASGTNQELKLNPVIVSAGFRLSL